MGSPEQIQGWIKRNSLERPAAERPLYVAFLGRTSGDEQQDPTLSLPRQLDNCRRGLPDGAIIVAHFYDVESGRMELAKRGKGKSLKRFDIPIPRDGGLNDLLDEAEREDRRFEAVICESIDRVARRTYYGTRIEHQLEECGIPLLAADEPISLPTPGRKAKKATVVLTRRVKQGVSEWYVLEMLEKAWDGYAIHTENGFNIGKPCYGFMARLVPHPVPKKRDKGAKKTLLAPHPVQGLVVKKIFAWRVNELLSYSAIAHRLNEDLDTNPPPTPVDPSRAVGRWTGSSVREVLTNPKHTGHMVWNRHARKSGHNRLNPPSHWVWSPEYKHEPLIDLETFVRAQEVPSRSKGSRPTSLPNKHPQTKNVSTVTAATSSVAFADVAITARQSGASPTTSALHGRNIGATTIQQACGSLKRKSLKR